MKVGIVATADANPYASTMVVRLVSRGHTPACIVLAEESPLHRLVAHVKVAGVRATLRKLARHYNVGGLPDRDARYYLGRYAESQGLADWDAPLSQLAAKHGIRLARVSSLHDAAAAEAIRGAGVDVSINAAGVIYKPPLLNASRLGMLNAHMAQLPRFRGMNVLEWSIWSDQPPAITVHFVTPGIDLGEILEVRPVPVVAEDTIATLRCAAYPIMIETMADCVGALAEGRETRTPQASEAGRQYFVMHPKLLAIVERKLARGWE